MTDMPQMPSNDPEEQGEAPMDPAQMQQEEATEPQGQPVPAQGTPQQPAPPLPPMDPVIDDMDEFETRDRLELELMLSAVRMCEAVKLASDQAEAKDAEQYAAAAQHLVQAAVLLAPQEAIDDATASGGDPAATEQVWASTTKGLRRKAGS